MFENFVFFFSFLRARLLHIELFILRFPFTSVHFFQFLLREFIYSTEHARPQTVIRSAQTQFTCRICTWASFSRRFIPRSRLLLLLSFYVATKSERRWMRTKSVSVQREQCVARQPPSSKKRAFYFKRTSSLQSSEWGSRNDREIEFL